jgi:hypothetical protein
MRRIRRAAPPDCGIRRRMFAGFSVAQQNSGVADRDTLLLARCDDALFVARWRAQCAASGEVTRHFFALV